SSAARRSWRWFCYPARWGWNSSPRAVPAAVWPYRRLPLTIAALHSKTRLRGWERVSAVAGRGEKREAGASPARSRHCEGVVPRLSATGSYDLGRRRGTLGRLSHPKAPEPGNLPALATTPTPLGRGGARRHAVSLRGPRSPPRNASPGLAS